MPLPPDQLLYFKQLKEAFKIPLRAIAKAAGVSHPTVMGWMAGTQEPTPEEHKAALSFMHEVQRTKEDANPILAGKRRRLTKSAQASTIDVARESSMSENAEGRKITYSEPASGNKSWPREVTDLCLSPEAEIGEFIIVEDREAEIGQAVEARIEGKFVHRYLWRDKGALVLKDASGILEDVAVEKADLRGVVVQKIELLANEVSRTTEYKHGMRRRF